MVIHLLVVYIIVCDLIISNMTGANVWQVKTGNYTSCLTGRVLLPAAFIFAVLRHRRVVKQDEAGGARSDGRLAGLCGRGLSA